MRLLRLFNENEGKAFLKAEGFDDEFITNLNMIGISGIGNILSAIKTAKHFEMNSEDVIFTLATDSAEMYISRLEELQAEKGNYSVLQSAKDYEKCLLGQKTDNMKCIICI
mgnify:FL=1